MKIIAINGSPRQNGNTHKLLKEALSGASSQGAEIEYIDLYSLNFKGCISCFACKRKGGPSYGKCAVRDDLTPLLEKIAQADAIIFGTPVYFGNVTSGLRGFLERLLYPYIVYDKNYSSLYSKKIKTALICTMGATEEDAKQNGWLSAVTSTANWIGHVFGSSQVLISENSYQFDDYSLYETSGFDLANKTKQREEQFPIDLQKAFQLGANLAS